MIRRHMLWIALFLLVGCSAQTTITPDISSAPAPASTQEQGASTTSPTRPTPEPAPETSEPLPSVLSLLDFELVLDRPIVSLAFGEGTTMAVLSDQPWVFDGNGWKEAPLPASLALDEASRVDIFFGRDNRPRLMGSSRETPENSEAIYLRLKAKGWQKEPSEIGRLAGLPKGGLFGVLGHEDPEVVCKVGDICLIKSRLGWNTVASGPGMPKVVMNQGAVWALHDESVMVLGEKGWEELPGKGAWSGATGLWAAPGVGPWVSVAQDNALFLKEGQGWKRMPSPVEKPGGLWGSSSNDVWVVGEGGLGYFDGKQWHRVKGIDGPLRVIAGRGKEVWVGGSGGVHRGIRMD